MSSDKLDMEFPIQSSTPRFGRMQRLRSNVLGKAVESIGLSNAQPPIMGFLVMEPNLTQKELADYMHVTQASIAMTISRMEKSGLIRRVVDETDSRKLRVNLTDKGFRLFIKVEKVLDDFDRLFFEGFTDDEKSLFLNFVQRSSDNLIKELDGEKSRYTKGDMEL